MRLYVGRSAIALIGVVTTALLGSSGATAQPSAAPKFAPQSIVWPTATDGYVLGGIGCGDTSCPAEVQATHDGGKTWATAGKPHNGLAKSGEPGLTSLQMANSKFGWAYDPLLEVTKDGGRTWTQVALPGGAAKVLNLLAATDGTYVVTSGCPIGSGVCDDKPLKVWRAPAGKSTNWQPVNVTIAADENAVFATHGSTVYLLVAPFVAPGRLNTLRDGKVQSTSTITCADAEDAFVVALATNADNRLFALCDANYGRGQSEKTVMVSGDGGKSFRYDAIPGTMGLGSELAVGADGAVMVSTVTASLVYNRPTLSKSWRVDQSWLENSEHIHDLVIQSATTAWLVERDAAYGTGTQLWVTRDAGKTWQPTTIGAHL